MKQNKRLIGISGGIGSGKSYVARILSEKYGLLYIDTDSLAKDMMRPGHSVYRAVVEEFGEGILSESGEIDRGKLSSVVFKDAERLKRLNELTHPPVIEEALRLAKEYAGDTLVESALIIEAGMVPLFDEIIVVTADRELRIERLVGERGYSREKAEAVINAQKNEEKLKSVATILIENGKGTTAEDVARTFEASKIAIENKTK